VIQRKGQFEDSRRYPDANAGTIFAEELFLEGTGGAEAQTLFVSELIGGGVFLWRKGGPNDETGEELFASVAE
jgi:hypothetical protein